MAAMARTIREQVTNQIHDDLVARNVPQGSVLRETERARRFGASRGPIRDAFLQLSQEGFLAYEANRRVKLRQPPGPENRGFIVSLRIHGGLPYSALQTWDLIRSVGVFAVVGLR